MNRREACWYVAIVVRESSSTSAAYEALFEEETVLVSATSEEDARAKLAARNSENASYENEAGERIVWKVRCVVDVAELPWGKLEDGATLYSRHFSDIDSYERFEPLLRGKIDEGQSRKRR